MKLAVPSILLRTIYHRVRNGILRNIHSTVQLIMFTEEGKSPIANDVVASPPSCTEETPPPTCQV